MSRAVTLRQRIRQAGGLVCAAVLAAQPAIGGGPLRVGGPGVGVPGVPLLWDNTKAITYRVDAGPLSRKPFAGAIVVDNPTGITRVNGMFGNWSSVPTANLNIQNGGGLLAIPSAGFPAGGDVQTAQQFLDVIGESGSAPDPNSCQGGGQSPIVFDADGSIFDSLGLPPEVIGFAFQCALNPTTGKVTTAGAILNGRFQDGINDNNVNYELTTDLFNQAFTHEFGHFLGLGHSQINLDLLTTAMSGKMPACTKDDIAGMPLMFPIVGICPARVTSGVPILSADDAAWISKLYPVGNPAPSGKTTYASGYGTITGNVYFSDGVTPAQGVNVIARSTTLPRRNAVSGVSGDLFTGNPGQTFTCVNPGNPTTDTCTNLGSSEGSRDKTLIGRFDIPVPPGTYTLSVESVFAGFTGGSSLTPLDPPIPAPGTWTGSNTVSVTAGGATHFDITLSGTQQRFDSFEGVWKFPPDGEYVAWRRRESLAAGRLA